MECWTSFPRRSIYDLFCSMRTNLNGPVHLMFIILLRRVLHRLDCRYVFMREGFGSVGLVEDVVLMLWFPSLRVRRPWCGDVLLDWEGGRDGTKSG